MAGASAPLQCLQREVTCPLCLHYYEHPVTIECEHTFCKRCITNYWEAELPGGTFSCPQCRKRIQQQSFQESSQLANVTEIVKPLPMQETKTTVCDLHGERLTLLCEEDQTIICALCKDAEGHKAHTVVPAEEAVQKCQMQLHKALHLLKKDMEKLSEWTASLMVKLRLWEEMMEKKQQLIEHSFKKAHQFLKEEEAVLLRRLEHEDHEKLWELEGNMNAVKSMSSCIQQLIIEMEGTVLKPGSELLKDTKSILTRRNNLRIQEPPNVRCTLKLNYYIPGILEMLRKYAVPITLDPETAHGNLVLSDDGKRVEVSNSGLFKLASPPLPSSPERFSDNPVVLGTGRFVTGRHYWEVECTTYGTWEVGVCLDSVAREGFGRETSPDNGFWTTMVGEDNIDVEFPTCSRMGIFLDYEAGELTFYSVDKREAIEAISDTFSGVLRPFFGALCCGDNDWLRLCPVSSPV